MSTGVVLDAIDVRTQELCDQLDACSGADLRAGSELPAWSRLTIACHLRFGARAFTEVEVHGSDLGLGLRDWSDVFVDVVLPARLDRLRTHRPSMPEGDSWLFEVADGPSISVTTDGSGVLVEGPDTTPGSARVVETDRRSLLALLLGRSCTGADEAAFHAAFPGP